MDEDHRLQGQVALVTGGGVGIGRAIAQALVGQQARVAICGRRLEELERAAGDLTNAVGEVLSIPCDVTQRVDVERTINAVIRKFGRLDILVNNAGASGRTSIHDPDDSQWQNILQVNLTGSYLCSKLAVPHMFTHRYGRIVNGVAPTTPGALAPGQARVLITRSTAAVPGCPDWSTKSDMNYGNGISPGYGCAVNSNLAAMVANPEDLLEGQKGTGETVVATGTRAIQTYREAAPTGAGGLQDANSGGN